MTVNEVPLYERPVPAVVVAPLYTLPAASTANSPPVSVGNQSVFAMVAKVVDELSNCEVEDAEREIPVAPKWIWVVVELAVWLKKPVAFGVKGKVKPA